MVGSRMYIYKQDPSMTEPGMRSTFISSEVLKGPKDNLIRVADILDIEPDENGDFLMSVDENRDHFDAVHAFAVCRQVLTMYQRAFNRLEILKEQDNDENGVFDFKKKWGTPLKLYVRALAGKLSALYTPGLNTIFFGYQNEVFTCRSFDIIAHETGHAVFDAIKTKKTFNHDLEALALEESFCDLTVIFTLLSQMDMCESVVALSKGNLSPTHNEFFFSNIAEECGMKKYQRFSLRNISKKSIYNEVMQRPNYSRYDLSLVFSSAVYHFLVTIFKDHICLNKYDPAETLFWLGRMVTELTVGAFYKTVNSPKLTFKSLGLEMVKLLTEIEKDKEYHESLNKSRRWGIHLLKIFRKHQVL